MNRQIKHLQEQIKVKSETIAQGADNIETLREEQGNEIGDPIQF